MDAYEVHAAFHYDQKSENKKSELAPSAGTIRKKRMSMETPNQAEVWIRQRLFDEHGYLSQEQMRANFERHGLIFEVQMSDALLESIINDQHAKRATPSQTLGYRYRDLLQGIHAVTNDERCYWFYVTDPDNALSCIDRVVEWQGPCYPMEHHLNWFIEEPAAQGGNACLGLLGADGRWTLAHFFNCESICVEFFGADLLCRELFKQIGLGA